MTKPIKPIPLNLNKGTCTEQSSNCITWQGPDIPCLGICKGACITQVIYDLAINFCNLYEQLDPKSYNTNCLVISSCGDPSFKDMVQALIDEVCSLKESEPFGGCNVLAEIVQDTPTTFSVTTTGATAPVTYKWSLPQTGHLGASITGAATGNTVTIAYNSVQLQAGSAPELKVNQALLKVVATDKNGCVATDFILINRAI